MKRTILVALLLVLSATPLKSQEERAEQSDIAKDTEGQESGADLPPLWPIYSLAWPASEQKKIEPDWRNPDCQYPHDHEEADLCEQRKMSEAAAETVFWNKWQFALSALGFAALLYTIYLTYRATSAAFESNEIARETTQQELRAYLAVRPHALIDLAPKRNPMAKFFIVNNGQTPAKNMRYIAGMERLRFPLASDQGDLAVPEPGARLPVQTVHPGNEIVGEAPYVALFDEHECEEIIQGKGFPLYLYGIVFYDDIFGVERTTKFCVYVDAAALREAREIKNRKNVAPSEGERTVIHTYFRSVSGNFWIYSDVHNEIT
jgi:hypothetical protein